MAIVLLLLALFQQHSTHAGDDRPAALMTGLGKLHHPIATKSREAQQFFNQGLTLVYGFNHDEAIRSFRRAAELDPASPMPRWGIALALGPNINLDVDPEREKAAYDEAQRAKMLALRQSSGQALRQGSGQAGLEASERAYVDALVMRYSNDPKADSKALAVQYKDAMRDLTKRYPNDLDAATLYAEALMDLNPWRLWSSDGKPAEGTEEIVAVLESVLRRDPMHVGANHYYIHAVEASRTPGRALPSASRLDTLVPAAGHLVHMPAHIYMRTGDYQAAVTSNAKAADVDRKYIEATKPGGVYPAMYYNHNLDFLASAAMMTGQFAEASRAADQLVAAVTPALAEMPMLEPFGAKKLAVLLRFSRWNDVLALAPPDAKWPLLTLLSHFGRGVAYAALRRVSDAKLEQVAYYETRKKISGDTRWGYNNASAVIAITDAAFDARVAAAEKQLGAAIEAWRRAVAAEDALDYNEPPDWFSPTRESLGAALMRNTSFEEAERVFRADLERNPKNGRSLFGLWQSLVAQDRTAEAARAEREFRSAWTHADVEMKLSDF
jgi:tetratricopeptide (TPR) repeat protein